MDDCNYKEKKAKPKRRIGGHKIQKQYLREERKKRLKEKGKL